jgi:hypothetical protein
MISDGGLKKGLMTLNIIWFALLISLAIYLFVGLQVAENLRTSLDSDTFTILKYTLYILVFITLVVTRYIRKFLLSPKGSNEVATQDTRYPNQHPAVGKYTTAMILTWAMSESIGIYGLILFFLGKNSMDLYLLISVSAAAMCMYRPKKDEIIGLSQDNFETTPGGVA